MGFKDKRSLSFAVVTIVYALAAAVGVFIYDKVDGAYWLKLFLADAGATVAVFVFSCLFKNASVYDPYWSVFPVCAIIAFSLGKGLTTLGAMLIVAVCAWGVRLTANWAYTFRGLRYEDWRYVMLAQKSGRFYPIVNLFGIHFVPTLIVFMCMLPAFYAIENGLKAAPLSYVFLLVSLLAALLQLVSDVQMHSFRRSRKGGLIRNGLWKNSRHPNYLGEILMWWGVGLSVFSAAPAKYWLLTGTLANMLMFLFISIPMADRRQSLKPGYDAYRARTRMLLPLPRRGGRP